MERLTAADASFLYMENSVVHMHVTGVLVLDPSTVPGGYTFRKLRAHVLGRLHLIPAFRRRLLRVPFGIDHPVWVEDPDFDVDLHLRRERLWAPGDRSQLATYVGNYASEPLDPSRPLWDMVVLEGLADGHVALVSKMHHVAVDGVSGTDLMAQLVDLTAVPETSRSRPSTGQAPPVPSTARLAAAAVASRASDPLRNVRALGRATMGLVRIGGAALAREPGHSMARPFECASSDVQPVIDRTARRRLRAGPSRRPEDRQDCVRGDL